MDHDNNFSILNSGYIAELYDRFLADPLSVEPAAREFFKDWPARSEAADTVKILPSHIDPDKIVGIANLAQAIRSFGHLAAHIDPLGMPPTGDPSLEPSTYGLDEADLLYLPASLVGGPRSRQSGNALEAIQALRQVYSSTIGFDYEHIRVPEERAWLREVAENGNYRLPAFPMDPLRLLERLTKVEAFEQFLNRFFPGKTRFSIEGVDMLVPMLDEIINAAGEAEVCTAAIGMGHRGRLNVLAHILSKPYAQIMAEFKDPGNNYTAIHGNSWTGDVKYHKGASKTILGEEEIKILVLLPANPSHLELINPVLSGMARAAQSVVDAPGTPRLFPKATLPIQIHGDASFPGEGVVAESLNLSRLPGYQTSGTIHLITNNQLGYTTPPSQGRSTLYASDLAKGFEIPIIHVNADEPQACIEAARIAFAYRLRFQKDFLIDLVGYRRYGHNEGDEPSFTQPVLYEKIDNHPTVRNIWADHLVSQELVEGSLPDKLVKEYNQELKGILDNLSPEKENLVPQPTGQIHKDPIGSNPHVDSGLLQALNQSILEVPEGFTVNRKLERPRQRWRNALLKIDEPLIEWSQAETLALASILSDGVAIRMTGQDVERGTFSQRHAVLHDAVNGQAYIPLQNIPQARAAFEIQNSPLSEAAALGFEYGYNIFDASRLVIWEAQYGDFFNNAQSIIDEFIVSGMAKWEQRSSLVLLLPHGYEGQGPNHSSARPERFLQQALETNLRVANCTTAAQYFHLLRLQAGLLKEAPLPLVVFTPKSLLRHPRVASSLRDLSEDSWMPILDDPAATGQKGAVRRLVLCSGKLAVDLAESEARSKSPEIAIVRVEQLCPFPSEEIQRVLSLYPAANEVVWAQEEPENMGAWTYIQPKLVNLVGNQLPFHYIGRSASPSPSEGSLSWHQINQKVLIDQVFNSRLKMLEPDHGKQRG